VNEQTEIGILLALPGLLGTLTFAPWLMHVLYSEKFVPGACMLPWFVVGVFGQLISWPLGMIFMAKGAAGWMFATRTHGNLVQLGLTIWFLLMFGLVGVSWAFAASICTQMAVVYLLAKHLWRFRWSSSALRLIIISTGIVLSGIASKMHLHGGLQLAATTGLFLVSICIALRGIAVRLGADHRVVRIACKFPGGRTLCGVCVSQK